MQTEAAPRRLLMPEDLPRPFRYATRRNPDLATRGGKVAVLGKYLGRELLPHQQYIADVAGELNPRGSRLRWRYQTVIVNEPRQVGKTTLFRPIVLERCLTTPSLSAFMTAQLGKDAGERWEDLVDDFEAQGSPFAQFVDVKRGKGAQRCTFPNGSFVAPFAPVRDGLHGESPDLVGIDEAWAHSEEAGRDIMRAVRPAMITRTARQVWIFSAAGTAASEWWNDLVEAGRASVDDPASTIAYFEHSMDPDADPYDPASWEFHPGLDGLITLDDLAEEAKPENNTHADFLRGFMNIPTKHRDTTVLDLEAWDDLAGEQEAPDLAGLVAGYDVAIDSTSASVWTAWRTETGQLNLHVLETREGTDWLPEFLRQLHEAGCILAADDGGPTRVVTAQLRRAGVPVKTMNGQEASTAWTEFKNLAAAGTPETFCHDGSTALHEAIEVATEAHVGDAVRLSRRKSLGPIDPLIAAVAATWATGTISTEPPIY